MTYLGSVVIRNYSIEEEVKERIACHESLLDSRKIFKSKLVSKKPG
jgi:hypothetical protein